MPIFTFPLVTAIGLAGTLAAEKAEYQLGKWICKPLASAGFIAFAVSCGALQGSYGRWVLAGLVLSWFGDVLLIPSAQASFRAGLVSFLLGHVAYVVAFAGLGVAWLLLGVAAVPAVLLAWVVFRWLRPGLGKMAGPVAAYVTVISAMVTLAVATVPAPAGWVRLAGAVSFYVSDLSVARDRFLAPGFINRLWGLPLYYGAQLLLAWSVAG
jgi:uncharacterized membrane protein YhhN